MKWIIELTTEEIDLLKNKLEELLEIASVDVEIAGPTRLRYSSQTVGQQRQEWVDFCYKIKISSPAHGVNEQLFGLSTREGARGDIEAHALDIARQFCTKIDPNLSSELSEQLWPNSNNL